VTTTFTILQSNQREETVKERRGGQIQGEDVFLLEDALRETYDRFGKSKGKIPNIYYTNSTMEEFEYDRHSVMAKYERALDENGKYLYFPYNAAWEYPQTMRNMVKQWHSIDAVWENMVHIRKRQNQKKYSRVAMLRNDVMYVTPFDIYKLPNNERDVNNNHFVIPDWANYPVNDRMVAGPYNAVKVWATQRFARIDQHVRTYPSKGWGMHSERYMDSTILPAMKKRGNFTLAPDPNLCFLRARADGSVWIQDCQESIQEDLEPKVMQLLEKYHSTGKEEKDGGITCMRKSVEGIKKQDVISCSGDPDMAVWKQGIGMKKKALGNKYNNIEISL